MIPPPLMNVLSKGVRALRRERQFFSDPYANLSGLAQGLRDHPSGRADPPELIGRLLKAYTKAKLDEPSASSCYHPNGAWQDLYTRRAEYLAALQGENQEVLAGLLTNFFRNSGVAGLMAYAAYQQMLRAKRAVRHEFINFLLADYRTLQALIKSVRVDNLAIPPIGNPWGYHLNGTLLLPTACRHYYHASQIRRLLHERPHPVVCEIGGGFGGAAYFLLNGATPITYLNFDLPEVLLVASYFLISAFPTRRSLLYGETSDAEALHHYDLILLPSFALPSLADHTIDLTLNTGSLSEMTFQTVEAYLRQIARITSAYFFHENSDRPTINTCGHHEVLGSQFPIPTDQFRQVSQCPSPWGGDGGRYREYLYQRV